MASIRRLIDRSNSRKTYYVDLSSTLIAASFICQRYLSERRGFFPPEKLMRIIICCAYRRIQPTSGTPISRVFDETAIRTASNVPHAVNICIRALPLNGSRVYNGAPYTAEFSPIDSQIADYYIYNYLNNDLQDLQTYCTQHSINLTKFDFMSDINPNITRRFAEFDLSTIQTIPLTTQVPDNLPPNISVVDNNDENILQNQSVYYSSATTWDIKGTDSDLSILFPLYRIVDSRNNLFDVDGMTVHFNSKITCQVEFISDYQNLIKTVINDVALRLHKSIVSDNLMSSPGHLRANIQAPPTSPSVGSSNPDTNPHGRVEQKQEVQAYPIEPTTQPFAGDGQHSTSTTLGSQSSQNTNYGLKQPPQRYRRNSQGGRSGGRSAQRDAVLTRSTLSYLLKQLASII